MTYNSIRVCLSSGIRSKINRERHGISFEEASELFKSGNDYLEIYDEGHSDDEERFIGIGPIRAGIVVIIYTERSDDVIRLISAWRARKLTYSISTSRKSMSDDDIRELTDEDFAKAMPRKQRERIMRGEIRPEKDIAALRRFTSLTQEEFADALGISVHTLRNWEQGRRTPGGPALALLRVAARHPRVLRENLAASA